MTDLNSIDQDQYRAARGFSLAEAATKRAVVVNRLDFTEASDPNLMIAYAASLEETVALHKQFRDKERDVTSTVLRPNG